MSRALYLAIIQEELEEFFIIRFQIRFRSAVIHQPLRHTAQCTEPVCPFLLFSQP